MTRTNSASNKSKFLTRVSQWVPATALMAGVAIGAAATAGAIPFDRDAYYRCVIAGGYIDVCCVNAGGDIISDKDGYPLTCKEYPDSAEPDPPENVPQPPAPTEPPPVLQNPPTQPSNPLIPTPRGPNSGTLG